MARPVSQRETRTGCCERSFPGLGSLVAVLIVIGGFAFNIGNVAGAGLGFNAIFGWDVRIGAAITGILAIIIFLIKNGRA